MARLLVLTVGFCWVGLVAADGDWAATSVLGRLDGPIALTLADLDNNSLPDIVSVSSNDNTICWFANLGNGSFEHTPRIISTSAGGVSTVTTADINGDGWLDVVAGLTNDDLVAWYRNNNGTISTLPEIIAVSVLGVSSVATADVDGDGYVDVISASAGDNSVAWYPNNRRGGLYLQRHVVSRQVWGVKDVFAADMDADGDMDLLCACFTANGVLLFRNDGAGLFGNAERVATSSVLGAFDVQAADLDGDGHLDVLVAAAGQEQVAWFRNLGNATFEPRRRIIDAAANGAVSAFAVDFDNDGHLDVLAAQAINNTIVWYHNLGNGAAFSSPNVVSTDSWGAAAVAAADLDADGLPDMVSASFADDKVAWYRHEGPRVQFDRPQTLAARYALATTGDLDHDGRVDLILGSFTKNAHSVAWRRSLNLANESLAFDAPRAVVAHPIGPQALFVRDLDSDGNLDLLYAFKDQDQDSHLAWARNDGAGNFATAPAQLLYSSSHAILSTTVADLDGNGHPDVLFLDAAQARLAWCANNGLGQFDTPSLVAQLEYPPSCLSTADLDGDGHVDVIRCVFQRHAIEWLRNMGNGSFASGWLLVTSQTQGPVQAQPADMDGDGVLDIVCASLHDAKLAWYHNDGLGHFVEHVISQQLPDVLFVRLADLTLDGSLDILVAQNSGALSWFGNEGAGTFAASVPIRFANILFLQSMDVVDLDGDGLPDILCGDAFDNTVTWFRSIGIKPAFSQARVLPAFVHRPLMAVPGDLNGDGHIDVVSASTDDSRLTWYPNPGNGAFTGTQHIISQQILTIMSLAVADLDNDQDLDILCAGSGLDQVAWFQNNGGGHFADEPRFISTAAAGAVAVLAADLDGDGALDAVVGRGDDNTIVWHRNNGQGEFGPATPLSTTAHMPWGLFAADLDDDGDLDVLSANYGNDRISWYRNNGAAGFGTELVITASADGVRGVFAADLDNDGDLDVLSASINDNKVAWYVNDGDGNFNFQERVISTSINGASAISAVDLDGDGDQDVLVSGISGNTVAWFENLGDGTFVPVPVVLTTELYGASWVAAADFDNDTRLDILSPAMRAGDIQWFHNPGTTAVPSASSPLLVPSTASGSSDHVVVVVVVVVVALVALVFGVVLTARYRRKRFNAVRQALYGDNTMPMSSAEQIQLCLSQFQASCARNAGLDPSSTTTTRSLNLVSRATRVQKPFKAQLQSDSALVWVQIIVSSDVKFQAVPLRHASELQGRAVLALKTFERIELRAGGNLCFDRVPTWWPGRRSIPIALVLEFADQGDLRTHLRKRIGQLTTNTKTVSRFVSKDHDYYRAAQLDDLPFRSVTFLIDCQGLPCMDLN
ncbi:uncharacterized protein MONBRDRAFT_11601 [Monosiga brevicollis MX1]|uniref:FG-GAP repeat protein n=1 Tax=Monosiga brevicollis TaxID=81824 RepID=A9V9R3_MONBE|nr:uncharacterized protein MONBRDRAFT_11601 [Monosiga brevicollis MX1]EDQ85769.1 predicted protein [Monosiga brevicollis MX1]|eukprot:XP_001749484.1 hypothetical protein [Monosiga brevicollis MX1]